jgi:hypothetical protein
MYEFYCFRGDLSHGWLTPITLARIAFPLIIKILLEKEEVYKLMQNDKV